MSKSKIVFVSHCILNTASKVFYHNQEGKVSENLTRKRFLKECASHNIQLIQLPCPEFLMYGANRWGHSKNQFDNPFYKEKCKEILLPYILQIKAYLNEPDRFDVLGIIGIDGSPSCGVSTCFSGKWGGEFSSCECIDTVLKNCSVKKEKGVFIEVLNELLEKEDIDLPMVALKNNVLNKLLRIPSLGLKEACKI